MDTDEEITDKRLTDFKTFQKSEHIGELHYILENNGKMKPRVTDTADRAKS